ncbi:bifunctional [glutamine synthetase] adenylyltransferase/[glutamine synthetase]-adenylyl-L-tyrosine phosphorylase [Rhodomicrobium sp. Az07]|uniref:bifunctional [glutamine synthetase] adenylyltransferase/[glutamine synthetase]-adenylyl-L-tyrosine phosphorylase n=1 Tax=Rhodomicrobium sp. Az07 TaxID=2839034 RepID=UPI001BE54EEC|nr:bifunctional [glutamine synthetase] adenylyltransferase/[glutamine synthetase]-adenylyl-L-tyrosine phosphorylase [Rhodomicrobium sp. Az07]MBT3071291.1 bifunctional [glutamine synthetase] adenylyltransferase/[glutamine synthetase]-adenylyl-L-tyrosine phosphorylase [Rhodomicrobium sp. Az07]
MPLDHAALRNRLTPAPLDDAAGTGRQRADRAIAALKARSPDATFDDRTLAFLSAVFAGSEFLFGLAERNPDRLFETLETSPEARFDAVLDRVADETAATASQRELMTALRIAKADLAFLVALADLGEVWSMDEVTRRLTDAADALVGHAVRFLLTRAMEARKFFPPDHTQPEDGSGFIILGMGKYGAHELNYSSDIDLIIFYDRETAPLGGGVEAQPFFVRLARDLVTILQERTADGYVFRTDLRLRPDPGSTQAAISTDAAFRYYESLGQNWERAAMIKARPVAGDIAAGEAFMKSLGPYIWRKYLDYNAISDIHAMKRQIHAAKGHEKIAVAGHNLKLGRGGIREIEFFVQSQQLIAGGRQPPLRTRRTITGLKLLTDYEWIAPEVRDDLSDAYRTLRRMEHRLQMVADQQTHSLPSQPDELACFARFAGYADVARFERDMRSTMMMVQEHYAALFEKTPQLTASHADGGNLVFAGDSEDPATLTTLGAMGFRNPSGVIAMVKGWHYGRYPAMRSARAREILTEFTPALLEAFGKTGDPDLALSTFDKFLGEVPTALQLFAMLRANPTFLHLLAQIMGSAPRLARVLSRRRRIMEALLDPDGFGEAPTPEDVRDHIRRDILAAETYDDRLDRARVVGQERMFLAGVELLSGRIDPREAGATYSLIAESVIEALLDAVQERYGNGMPAPVVLAMGKLGGRETTASSDVDLIVVYDVPQDKAQAAPQHYARLTQRLISALSAPTPEGELYAVDMRLRPSGKAGPVAVRLDGFLSYQKNEAWTWEHLALTRARPIAGPPELRERLSATIRDVLTLPRDRAKTAADVLEMRALIEKEKGTRDIWQLKTFNGGLIDVEFIAQFLQVMHANRLPDILDQNTEAALRKLVAAGVLDPEDGGRLIHAAELYNDVSQILRLCTEGAFDPAAAPRDLVEVLLHVTGEPDIARLEGRLRDTYAEVAALFSRLVR